MRKAFTDTEEYINSFSDEVRKKLKAVRKIILDNAPNAFEEMAYGMPAFKTNKKPLVYFAGYANHIGFYATESGHKKFKKQLSKYKHGKGSVQLIYELSDGSSLHVTSAIWLTPQQHQIEGQGLTPDIYVPYESGSQDKQLDRAISHLQSLQ